MVDTKFVLVVSLVLIFSMTFVPAAAVSDDIHLNIQTTDSNENVVTGTFDFVFDITTDSSCTNVVYSDSASLTTDSRGIISYYLRGVSLDYENQYWLCYYRDGELINNSQIGRVPYAFRAKYLNLSGLEVDQNLDMGIYNVSASHFIGDGSGLANLNISSLDMSDYFTKTNILDFGYYNLSDFDISDYYLASNPNSYLNETTLNLSGVNYWAKSGNNLYYNKGNVGIGMTNPQAKLDVNGVIRAGGNLGTNLGRYSSSSNGYLTGYFGSNVYWNGTYWVTEDDGFSNAGGMIASSINTGKMHFYTIPKTGASSQNIDDSLISSYERMTIDSSGNVGIGTTSPRTMLNVKGDISVNYGGTYRMYNSAGTGWGQMSYDQSSNMIVFNRGIKSSSGSFNLDFGITNSYINANGGNLGIGTTSPGAKLDVQTGANDSIVASFGVDANNRISLYDYESGGFRSIYAIDDGSYGSLNLGHATSPYLFVETGGNVGIGTANPGEKLDVQGNINATGDVCANGICLSDVASNASSGNVGGVGSANRAAFWTDADTLGYDGNFTWDDVNKRLGIGTTTPQQKLHVTGSAVINGTLVGLSNATDPTGAVTKSQLDAVNSALSGNISDNYVPYTGATQNVDLNSKYLSNVDRLGIGIVSPQAALHVNYPTSGNVIFQAGTGDGGSDMDFKYGYNGYGWYNRYLGSGGGDNNEWQLWSEGAGSTDQQVYGIKQSGNIDFKKQLSVQGDVGIGTTTPQQKLHVTGNAVFNGTINTDGNKIINLANGTAAQDAVTKSQLDAVNSALSGNISDSYVPYTGATGNVNLGSHNLITTGNVIGNIAASNITSGTLAVARGGTGIASYTTGNYIYASGATTLAQRTPAEVRANIGALNKSGDTMSGALAMGTNKITGLGNGTAAQDAVTLSQLQAVNGSLAGDLNNYYLKSNPYGYYNSTTDGAGSGLDADTLDGLNSSNFANVSNSVYYVEGTGTTAGTWLGSHPDITEYYDGLKIAYKIGIAGASTTTLNINDLGASQVYRATGALTTHLPVNTVVYLTYTTVSGVGRWVWANYVDGTESYTVRWNGAGVVAGESITKYKLLMMAPDGRYHPIAVGDSTAANAKTINSQPFVVNSPILAYYTTATVAQNAATSTSSIYSAVSMSTNFRYNQNVQSGWIAHKPIYLKGTINNDGLFVLAGAGTTGGDYLTQDLPTTEDGYVYIMLGMMYSTTTSFRLNIEHPIIEFKDGKLRQYNSPELDPFYFSNPYNYLNSTSISGSETDPKWTGNYSTFLTHINWAQVTNGTMATAASVTAANTSMKNYVDYTNGTMKNYVDTNFYLKSNPYNYLNSTSISGAETDPKWTGNYSSRTGTGNVVYSANSVLTGTSFVETIRSTPSNGGAAFRIGGSNNDVSLFRVDASTGTSDSANYGFSLKYMGSRSGNENSLSLFTDQQTGSQMEAITVQQNGNVGIGTTSPSEKLDVQGGVNIYLG